MKCVTGRAVLRWHMSTESTVSFRIDSKQEKQLDALTTHWSTSRSDVLRRLLAASENYEALPCAALVCYRVCVDPSRD